jgi:tricarballylate dehydrogenase
LQPDQIAYSIIDAKSINLFMPSIFPAVEAGSIGELAVKLNLDPAALQKTVAEFNATVAAFNAAVQPGTFDHTVLDDCRTEGLSVPKTHWARRIDTPPYYGYPLRPGVTFTYLGVRVNEESRMLMADGRPSGNLFAAGEIMAGNVLGKGYLAGIGMTIGAVFGRLAGEGAAKNVGN